MDSRMSWDKWKKDKIRSNRLMLLNIVSASLYRIVEKLNQLYYQIFPSHYTHNPWIRFSKDLDLLWKQNRLFRLTSTLDRLISLLSYFVHIRSWVASEEDCDVCGEDEGEGSLWIETWFLSFDFWKLSFIEIFKRIYFDRYSVERWRWNHNKFPIVSFALISFLFCITWSIAANKFC